MKKSLILLILFVIFTFSIILPQAYATTGEITLENSEFTLYRGNMITFPVIIEMNDYSYRPTLEIMYDDKVTQKISLHPIGDTFQSIIGLNENWESGDYTINLKYHGMILDSKSFVILRDNEVESKTISYKKMHENIDSFISISPNELTLEFSSSEIITITSF